MNLIEFNETLMKKKKTVWTTVEYADDDILQFRQMLTINSFIESLFGKTDDCASFIKAVPAFKEVFDSKVVTELFYAVKLGYYCIGVPSKLLYIINKIFGDLGENGNYINLAIESGKSLLEPYAEYEFDAVQDGEIVKYTVVKLIESRINKTFKLLTDAVPMVKVGEVCEVYVRNVDRVALIPNDIMEGMSFDNIDSIEYKPRAGIVFRDIPLREFGSRIGVTTDEFDLRECL